MEEMRREIDDVYRRRREMRWTMESKERGRSRRWGKKIDFPFWKKF
jgi:hypothetical protein